MNQQTINTYNKLALEYDEETVDFWERFPKTFLNTFTHTAGNKILNVGSGPGRDGSLLKQAGKDVTCIDASEKMVALSKERGLTSLVGDFNELPFRDHSFDGVWSYTALLHVPKSDIHTPLKEIYRILKPHGYFALGMVEGDFEGYRTSSGVSMERWFSFYTKDEIEQILQHCGFELHHFEIYSPGSKKYLNFICRRAK